MKHFPIILLATLVLPSCDRNKVSQEEPAAPTSWTAEGIDTNALAKSSIAVSPRQPFAFPPDHLIEVSIDKAGTNVLITTADETTRHGPITSYSIPDFFRKKEHFKIQSAFRISVLGRLQKAIGQIRSNDEDPVILVSFPANTPTLVTTCVIGACTPIDFIDLYLVTKPQPGDSANFRVIPYHSSRRVDLESTNPLKFALIKNRKSTFELITPQGSISFPQKPGSPQYWKAQKHLQAYTNSMKTAGLQPVSGVINVSSRTVNSYQSMIDALAFFRQSGIKTCSFAPSPIHWLGD